MKWYAIGDEDRTIGRMLPPVEDDESGFSVDVLVCGTYIENNQKRPMYGIGYTDRSGKWFVATTNGTYNIDMHATTHFTPLMWVSLPDAPAEIPPLESVKNNPENAEISWLPSAEKSPDPLTSPNTNKPPDWLTHWEAE